MTLSAKFNSAPDTKVDAVFNSDSNRLEGPFTVTAEFSGSDIEHGEYRQYIRGFFKIDGKKLTYFVCGDIELDEKEYREDGCGYKVCTAYGHRTCPNYRDDRAIDEYLPVRKNGSTFTMLDIPGLGTSGPKKGTTLELQLEFRGVLINMKSGEELATKEWEVSGKHVFAAAKRSKQVTKLSNGKTVHVRLLPDGESGWQGILLISGSDLASHEVPKLSFGAKSESGEPIPIDKTQTGDLIEVGSPRNRTWNIAFKLLNRGEEPAEVFGRLDDEDFRLTLTED